MPDNEVTLDREKVKEAIKDGWTFASMQKGSTFGMAMDEATDRVMLLVTNFTFKANEVKKDV